MVKRMGWLIGLLCCLAFNNSYAATITAEFDRNPVALGDPVNLRFTADDTVEEPNFAVLEKDFEIRGHSQSNSFNMDNNGINTSTTWELNVVPKTTGTLKVPSIAFGKAYSPALELTVTDPPAAGNAASGQATQDDLLVEVEVDNKTPVVQQQVLVTQRLLFLRDFQPQATLTQPEITQGKGSLQQLGKDKSGTLMRNGHNYRMLERRFALVPQQSGELTLGRSRFEGLLIEPGYNRFDPFGMDGKPVQRYSQPITLNVGAQPKQFAGAQWLPAKNITLNAHWQTPPDKLKAGEPVTLTLAIMAEGLTAEQLPPLKVDAPAGIKAYTNKPELRNQTSANGVVGVRNENWVILAPYNGSYQLPAITLDWWNVNTQKAEQAKIDAVTLMVSGGQAAPTSTQTQPPASTANQAAVPNAAAPSNNAQAAPDNEAEQQAQQFTLAKVAIGLLLVWLVLSGLWLIWLWWRRAKVPVRASSQASPLPAPTVSALDKLEQACQQNDAPAAYKALQQWAEANLYLRPALMPHIRARVDSNFQAQLDQLEAAVYGKPDTAWQGQGLWQAIQAYQPSMPVRKAKAGLQALYPE